MIALNEFDKICVIAEIKNNPENLSLSSLEAKANALLSEMKGDLVEYLFLSLEEVLGQWIFRLLSPLLRIHLPKCRHHEIIQ